KTATDLRSVVGGLKESMDQLNQGLNGRDGVRAQLGSLSTQLKDMRAAASTQALETPEDLMRSAAIDNLAGNWSLAIGDYKEFLENYQPLARAQRPKFKIGDEYNSKRKYEPAITEYDLLLQKYPQSDKTVGALYKEGLAFKELGQTDKATAAMERIVMEFPSS